MRCSFLTLIFLISLPLHSYAIDKEARNATINLVNDYTSCYAFWAITKVGAPNPTPELSKKIEVNQKHMLTMAAGLQKQIGGKEESIWSSIENMIELQKRSMDGDFANYSILSNKYLNFCLSLRNNPEARLEYWMNK